MIKLNISIKLAAVMMLFFSSCDRAEMFDVANGDYNPIYVSGYAKDGSNDIACYWKVTGESIEKTDLPHSGNGYGEAITMYNGTVYVAGRNTGTAKACLWRDGYRQDFTDGTNSFALDLYTDGSDVYVAGYYDSTPCYWQNGTVNNLAGGSFARSIEVSGGETLLAGYTGTQGLYWLDGTPTSLPDAAMSDAFDSISYNGTVYTCGSNNGIPCYWEDTTKYDLPYGSTPSNAQSIYVDNGNFYIAGYHSDAMIIACYWKNGVKTDLSDDSNDAKALSIVVSNGNVYVAGFDNDPLTGVSTACLWINGQRRFLINSTSPSEARDIYKVNQSR